MMRACSELLSFRFVRDATLLRLPSKRRDLFVCVSFAGSAVQNVQKCKLDLSFFLFFVSFFLLFLATGSCQVLRATHCVPSLCLSVLAAGSKGLSSLWRRQLSSSLLSLKSGGNGDECCKERKSLLQQLSKGAGARSIREASAKNRSL